MGEIDAENCIFVVMTTAKHLDIHRVTQEGSQIS